jgi:hypothetical protein
MICLKAAPVHMIRIITIEREYGSGAARIAATLAAQLGWTLWDQLLRLSMLTASPEFLNVSSSKRRRRGTALSSAEDRSTSCESVMTLCASFSTLPEKTKYGDSSPKETRKRAQ